VNIQTRSVRATSHRAFTATPERFVRGVPTPPALPQAVWVNKPRTLGEHDYSRASATELELAAAQLTVTGSVLFLLTASAPDTGGAWGDVGKERCPRLPGERVGWQGVLAVHGDSTSGALKCWPTAERQTGGPEQPRATSLR